MRVDTAHEQAVTAVASNLRAGDLREFLPLSHAESEADLILDLRHRFIDHPSGFSFHLDEPIGIGAMVESRPNVITLLFFATERFNEIALPLAKFTRRRLFPSYVERGVHRIECVSIDGYTEAHRWIELVGMQRECTMRGYGRSGETYHQFSWVSDDCSARHH